MDITSEWDALNPKDFNYTHDVVTNSTSLPLFLGNYIDITNAYILDSNFDSGIIENSDWNSGYHINDNNDVVITSITSSGVYNLEIDSDNNYLIAKTNINYDHTENSILEENDIIFLNSIDYDTRGMVTNITLLATGSGYNTTSSKSLVDIKVDSLTMSSIGSYYLDGIGLSTNSSGNGTGLTLDIKTNKIGSVMSITYSAPITGGGSYSMNLFDTVSTNTGPIATASFIFQILTDDLLGTVTGISATQNGGLPSTYSVFGPPTTTTTSGATGVGVIFLTGPIITEPNGATSSPITLGTGLTINYETSTDGSITSVNINDSGLGYEVDQIFKIEGGNATFSITSVSNGEVISYEINNPGEDYLIGDSIDIIRPYDPNLQFSNSLTASFVVTSVTVSNYDKRGLTLDITTGITGDVI
jgi:hypothetical protein